MAILANARTRVLLSDNAEARDIKTYGKKAFNRHRPRYPSQVHSGIVAYTYTYIHEVKLEYRIPRVYRLRRGIDTDSNEALSLHYSKPSDRP